MIIQCWGKLFDQFFFWRMSMTCIFRDKGLTSCCTARRIPPKSYLANRFLEILENVKLHQDDSSGRGRSKAVEQTPRNQEVMGLNQMPCILFFFFLFS